MSNKKLLIVHKGQLGSLTDSYKWCEILRDKYDITYIELDGPGWQELSGVKRITVPSKGNRFFRGIRYMIVSCLYMLFFKGAIMVVYFPGCELYKKLFPWKRLLLDLRTLSVLKDQTARKKENEAIRKACQLYGRYSIIQEDLVKELHIDVKYYLLPLGADVISSTSKTFDTLRLLYVGTLEGRHIDETVRGLKAFLMANPKSYVTYDIIGEGFNDSSEKLRQLVSDLSLSNVIKVHGRKPYNTLKPFFDKCNIGVSYVPVTPWYDHQPPTKTFEYIMSGMYCLATNTSENVRTVKTDSGIVHKDTSQAFADALSDVYAHMGNLDSLKIRTSISGYSWPEIVNHYLEPILEEL